MDAGATSPARSFVVQDAFFSDRLRRQVRTGPITSPLRQGSLVGGKMKKCCVPRECTESPRLLINPEPSAVVCLKACSVAWICSVFSCNVKHM
ncbi:hypothetical protein V5799_009085 [Amblyomma americanum]|uniref:Uncharacterized protein n=1 Tax=Amblyomma americanum TaxID=6943 RepID=A0AAQ4FBI7_AMBAM